MGEKKRIYISDVHMNAGRGIKPEPGKHPYEWLDEAGANRLAEFLKDINNPAEVKEIILLGDLMDNWVYPVHEIPPTFQEIIDAGINKNIVRELKKLSQNKDLSILYFPGNHDMGLTKEDIDRNFPGMIFGGKAMHDSAYRTGRLHAEHGSAYAMFNAPDAFNSPGSRLPLGYFISRIVATREYETGISDRHSWTYADDILEILGPQKLAASIFEAVLEEAGLPEDTKINMPPKGGKPITISASEVKEKYSSLYDQWQNHYGPGVAYKAIMAEIGYLGDIADNLCKKSGTTVVILGHSHDWELDKDSWFVADRIYANCGTWCDDKSPCTYVETEKDKDNKMHTVRVMEWKDNQSKLLKEETVAL